MDREYTKVGDTTKFAVRRKFVLPEGRFSV